MKTTTSNEEIKNDYDVKQIALAAYLECEPGDLTEERYNFHGLPTFSLGDKEYAIGDDDEVTQAAYASIKDSAWAFNASFLAGFCDLPEEVFTCLQGKCEDANDAVLSLIEKSGKFEDFADQAISSDGRGHFMSSYDGNENEYTLKAPEDSKAEHQTFYIYRLN